MKYVCCFSGGHGSAVAAIEAVRRYGKEDVILLNHDISPEVERADIKAFKQEVSNYLGLPITYANAEGYEVRTPLQVCRELGAFQVKPGQKLCTYHLKTKPFYSWLDRNFPTRQGGIRNDVEILYGFGNGEQARLKRRESHLISLGYRSDFPLFWENRTLHCVEDAGLNRPGSYRCYCHGNCLGCLKAGKRHWYVIYCLHPGIFWEAVATEEKIGHSIINGIFLKELIEKYEKMKDCGVCPTEKGSSQAFWGKVKKMVPGQMSFF